MEFKAYAKINLSLDVTGVRGDGYHLLKMIMQSIDLYDVIRVEKSKKGINLRCSIDTIPVDNRNIAYRAAELFIKSYNIKEGVDIYIEKNIPVEAGLAGGSTDGAAVLKAMRDIFRPEVLNYELANIGVKLGADVPYCIYGGTAVCEGIGEIITPLKPFRNHILVLVKPNFGASTKEVYKEIDNKSIFNHPDTEIIIKAVENNDLKLVCSNMVNVLENVTLEKYVELNSIKEEVLNFKGLGALMSGSGSTIFGFFEDMYSAQKYYDYMKLKYKQVFITRTI